MEIIKLDDKIFIYKKAIKNPERVIERAEKNYKWNKWFDFGSSVSHGVSDVIAQKTFPTAEEYEVYLDALREDELNNDLVDIEKVFYETSSHYVQQLGWLQDNWFHDTPALCKYLPVEDKPDHRPDDIADDLEMIYHTDYQKEQDGEPGEKFTITVTMYLNDNYIGGELLFKIIQPDGSTLDISYKPEAGDVVIFPAGEPYYHAVKTVSKGPKYFYRNFWLRREEASQDYLDALELYKNEEEFLKYLKNRRESMRESIRESNNPGLIS